MLPRTLATCLRRTTAAVLLRPCAVCTCRCGAPLSRRANGQGNDHGNGNGNGIGSGSGSQKRWVHASQRRPQRQPTTRRAPSTRHRQNPPDFPPAQAREIKELKEALEIERWIAILVNTGKFSVTTEAAMAFLQDFGELLANARGRPTVDPEQFNQAKDKYGLSGKDCLRLARLLLANYLHDDKFTGRKLLNSLSRAGNVLATIQIMANAVQQQKTRPGALKSPEIQYAKAHLAKLAAEGKNYRAMVLEGKVALALQDESRAIDLWTKAMSAALQAAEEEERNSTQPKTTFMPGPRARDRFQLDSPWIELMVLHYTRSKFGGKDEMSKCQWAMEIGCEQDDPVSHYYASTFTKLEDDCGNHRPTSDWLYHITKAAASGHQKAMHELGVFYAQSGWKYIEDEPPDHVKPTPFDSYPAARSKSSMAATLRSWVGIHTRKITMPADSIFQSAAFPDTALGRWSLALQWLNEASRYFYAPSYLTQAQLYMQETLWSGANAPKSALRLSKERYSHKSKEDHDAGIAIKRRESTAETDPPNPYYNADLARKFLREIFYAHQAHGCIAKAKERYASERRRGITRAVSNEDDIISEDAFHFLPLHIRKWFRWPEVREMYEAQIDELYQEAKELCDERQWDIFDDDGNVVYMAERNAKEAKRMAASA